MLKHLLITSSILFYNYSFGQENNSTEQSFSLKQAQDYGIKNNYRLQSAKKDVLASKKKVWETTAIGLPQVNVEGNIQKFLNIPINLAPANSFNPNAPADEFVEFQFGLEYNNSIGISASQLIFDGAYIVGLQAAKTYKDLSINNQTKTELELKEAITQAYHTVLIAQENTSVLRESLESTQSILKESQSLYREGLVEEQNIDQLLLNVNELKTSVGIAEGQIRFAKKLLKLQMGMDVDSPITLSESLDSFIEDITSHTNKKFEVNNHIDYTLAQTNEKLMQLNLRKEKYSFLPSLNVFFNHQEQNPSNEFDFFSGGTFFPSTVLGASLKLPILTSGSRIAKMSQAKIEWEKSQLTSKELEQQLTYQSQLAISNVETAIETYKNQKENMDLAKKIYDKTIKKYNEGIASSLELSQVHNQYLETEGKYIQALFDLLKSKSELQKSYGN